MWDEKKRVSGAYLRARKYAGQIYLEYMCKRSEGTYDIKRTKFEDMEKIS